jgi:hypothetical protein
MLTAFLVPDALLTYGETITVLVGRYPALPWKSIPMGQVNIGVNI